MEIKSKKKVLIISYDFYPETKPNTYRWYNIAKKWVEKGLEVYVISGDKNEFIPYEEIEGVKIYRTTEYFFGKLKYGSVNQNEHAHSKVSMSSSFNKLLKRVLREIYAYSWAKLYWPDYSFLWFFSAYPVAARLIKENNINKLITVSWTFTAHLIGLRLKKNNKSIYWLADSLDPFSFNPDINNQRLYKKWNKKNEKLIFETADVNTVLTNNIQKKYVELFPKCENKIFINNNVFIPNDFNHDSVSVRANTESINIVFVGTLNLSNRSPKNTLDFFSHLLEEFPEVNFKIDFYGEITDCLGVFQKHPNLLNNRVFINGLIDRDKVRDIIKNANILLNIGNDNEYQEPSKLIEYMYSRKRILNICSINNDTSANLLKIYPLAFNVCKDEIFRLDTKNQLIEFFKNNKELDEKMINNVLNDYLLESVSDKYLKLLYNEDSK